MKRKPGIIPSINLMKQPPPPKGYDRVKIHELMIQDRLRILSYKRAIEANLRPSDVVLDLGCGSGILSFFAAQKGCRKIYAIEKSGIIENAKRIAAENGLDGKIQFVRKDIFKFRPPEPIDLLIHEQIGQFLWNEGLVRKVAYVRDRFLKKGGRILPFKIDVHLAPVSFESESAQSVRFWSRKRYGIDFRPLAKEAFLQNIVQAAVPSLIQLTDTKTFLAPDHVVYSVDLRRETKIPRKISAAFRIRRSGRITGMCGFFTIHLDHERFLSTRPRSLNTHWRQIFIPCFGAPWVKKGSTLHFVLSPRPRPSGWKFRFELV